MYMCCTYNIRGEAMHCLVFARAQPPIQHVRRVGSTQGHAPPSPFITWAGSCRSCQLEQSRRGGASGEAHSCVSIIVDGLLNIFVAIGRLQQVTVGNLLKCRDLLNSRSQIFEHHSRSFVLIQLYN